VTQEKKQRTLLKRLRPRGTRLEHLEVKRVAPEEKIPESQADHSNSARLETVVDDDYCEYVVESRLLLTLDATYSIHVKTRTRFTMLKPVEQCELEDGIDEIETILFSPISLIIGFVTQQMGLVPVIVPPIQQSHDD
jgi:hypothetical protein